MDGDAVAIDVGAKPGMLAAEGLLALLVVAFEVLPYGEG